MNDKETVKETKEPFEKRHPILNTIIGIIILLVLIVIILFLSKYLFVFVGKGIDSFFTFLKRVATNLEAVIIVALITGALSITGVVVSKVIDYKQKRRDYLYQKREDPYSDFVEMVYKLQESTKRGEGYGQSEMLTDMLKFSRKLTLWGSNRVIKKYLKFRDQSINQQKTPQDILFVMEDIIYAMRKDLGLKRMKKGNLLAIFINDIASYLNR